ncbi:MAG: hypothetical protein J5517_10460 [Eubacterium sp.]|nr:hypothetical protein [Eubacterium sp.]
MKFNISKKVYSSEITDKQFSKLLRRVSLKRPVKDLYVVTPPLYEAGIMEIYNYNELLQPFYRKQKQRLDIYGIAKSRDAAKQIVCDILEDAYRELGGPDIKGLFADG